MINIRKGQVNRVALSLSELSILTDPDTYRFELKSENSEAIAHTFTKTPIIASERVQIFEIEEGVDVTLTLGGYYSYEIYQTTANNLVEVGLLRVATDADTTQKYTDSTKSQVYGS
jgi:hypothetical protein